jgi:hypothetical protein
MHASAAKTAEPVVCAPTVRLLEPKRFTLDGDDRLEGHITRLCSTALLGVQRIVPPRALRALWLGGGYGRGEGGVLRLPSGDWPYNDLEFYVCVRGNRFLNRRRFGPPLHDLAQAMTPAARVDVEFQIVSCAQLQHSGPSMFYYDLAAGHHQLAGREGLLDVRRHAAASLPLAEATRLLMNRGSGLVLARQKLRRHPLDAADADFIGRNIAKARLALGDAVLTVLGHYHWSCVERHRRLVALPEVQLLPWAQELLQHHAAGVEFKLHPIRSSPEAEGLRRDHARVVAFMGLVWLWVESRRLGRAFGSAREYVASTVNKWPESPAWRNRLLNAWLYGPAAGFSRSRGRHPRERVLNALAILLWDDQHAQTGVPVALHGSVRTSAPGNSLDPVASYVTSWERVR